MESGLAHSQPIRFCTFLCMTPPVAYHWACLTRWQLLGSCLVASRWRASTCKRGDHRCGMAVRTLAGALRHWGTTPNDGSTRGLRTNISRFWKRRWIYWFWAQCWNPHARGGGGHCTANMESLQAVRQSLQSGRKSLHRLWGLCAQSLRTWAVSCPHSLAGRVCLTMGAMSGIRGSAAPCHVSPFGTTCPTSRSSLRPQLHGHVIGCRWLQAPRRQRRPDWGRLPISLNPKPW